MPSPAELRELQAQADRAVLDATAASGELTPAALQAMCRALCTTVDALGLVLRQLGWIDPAAPRRERARRG